MAYSIASGSWNAGRQVPGLASASQSAFDYTAEPPPGGEPDDTPASQEVALVARDRPKRRGAWRDHLAGDRSAGRIALVQPAVLRSGRSDCRTVGAGVNHGRSGRRAP